MKIKAPTKLNELNEALRIALDLPDSA